MTSYYIYNRIPGQHHNYSVAVLAVNRQDAKNYMQRYWGGGIFSGEVTAGEVRADCGAVTSSAEAILRRRRQEEEEETPALP
jgi:hypothetical protein